MSSPYKFNIISTFSGCGGSSLGYQLAGGKVRLAVEIDDNAVATYRLNFPDTPIYHGDIGKLSAKKALELAGLEPGELDILDGSPPCQGFSTAGKRNFGDSRNQLFREFARLLKELQPRAFVMENVSGMVKGKMKILFVECLRELKACGYKVKGRILNAMYYNVPQSRERLIFIGSRDDNERPISHPRPQCRPVPLKTVIPAASASRSQGNNPWITANRPICTITKTPYKEIVKLRDGSTRPLTDVELRIFGSFPVSFKFAGTDNDIWARIGNSVPPNFMRAIAAHIYGTILHERT